MMSLSVFEKLRYRRELSWQACTVVGDTPAIEPFWSCTNQWIRPMSVWFENERRSEEEDGQRGILKVTVWADVSRRRPSRIIVGSSRRMLLI